MRGRLRWFVGSDMAGFGIIEANDELYYFTTDALSDRAKTKRAIKNKLPKSKSSYINVHCMVDFTPATCHDIDAAGTKFNRATNVNFDLTSAKDLSNCPNDKATVVDTRIRCAARTSTGLAQSPPVNDGVPDEDADGVLSGTVIARKIPRGAFVGGEQGKILAGADDPNSDEDKMKLVGGEMWRYKRHAIADAWLDETFPPITPKFPILIHVAIIAGGKGDLMQAIKVAEYLAGQYGSDKVGLVTVPDQEKDTGIVQSRQDHASELVRMLGNGSPIKVLVSTSDGLTQHDGTPPGAFSTPCLVIGFVQAYLYTRRLKDQLKSAHQYFCLAEAGIFKSELTQKIETAFEVGDPHHTGMGVTPVDRGLLGPTQLQRDATVEGIGDAQAGRETRKLLLTGLGDGVDYGKSRRLYLAYGHVQSYLRMFLGACIRIEAGKSDRKGFDIVMPTSWLDIRGNVRSLFEVGPIIDAAETKGDIADGDMVTLHRHLGNGDTPQTGVLHYNTTALTRTIRIIDPYFKLAQTTKGATDGILPGFATMDMGKLQAASEPFTLCTGENTLAEVVALNKLWLYEVIEAKVPLFEDLLGMASGLGKQQALAYLNATWKAYDKPDQIKYDDAVDLAAKLNAAATEIGEINDVLRRDYNGYVGILRRAQRLITFRTYDECTECKVTDSIRQLEELVSAQAQGPKPHFLDPFTTDGEHRETLARLLGFAQELVQQGRVRDVKVGFDKVKVTHSLFRVNEPKSFTTTIQDPG